MAADEISSAVRREQVYLNQLYDRRDELLERVADDMVAAVQRSRDEDDVTAQATVTRLVRRRHELERADRGLCFGRMDRTDGSSAYVGRLGLPDVSEDADPMVLDWRAPAARAFYTATAAQPAGLSRRRHIATDGRLVTRVDDETLVGDAADPSVGELVGEAALMAALDARRTGTMGDVVATLQGEQDEIIRADHRGLLVVQGGPGTGKTAVALHRAAYLLFTHEHLIERGVLVVGPSRAFLDYIGQVLPSLGETQVVAATVTGLLPGVRVTESESEHAAQVKGRAVWARVLRRAVDRRGPVAGAVEVLYDGAPARVDALVVQRLVERALAGRAPGQQARAGFRTALLDALVDAVVQESERTLREVESGLEELLARVDGGLRREAEKYGTKQDAQGVEVDGVASAADITAFRVGLRDSRELDAAVEAIWPALDPATILGDLLGDQALLAELAPELSAQDRAVLTPGQGWAAADVALLDELAELVGESTPAADPPHGSDLAARASGDRTWAYGHIIVDEAQELSAMEWRMLERRCPTRSFTVVGDINQASAPGAATSWDEALDPSFGARWRRRDLTVCYRTPHEVMRLTEGVLAAGGSSTPPPRAVRSTGIEPGCRRTTEADLPASVGAAVAELAERYAGGQVAVVAPAARVAALRDLWQAAPPGLAAPGLAAPGLAAPGSAAPGSDAATTGHPRVLTPHESKGLEFDAVVLVDPHTILAEPHGWNALYVALTRCTQELTIVALSEGPPELTPAGGSGPVRAARRRNGSG